MLNIFNLLRTSVNKYNEPDTIVLNLFSDCRFKIAHNPLKLLYEKRSTA